MLSTSDVCIRGDLRFHKRGGRHLRRRSFEWRYQPLERCIGHSLRIAEIKSLAVDANNEFRTSSGETCPFNADTYLDLSAFSRLRSFQGNYAGEV